MTEFMEASERTQAEYSERESTGAKDGVSKYIRIQELNERQIIRGE